MSLSPIALTRRRLGLLAAGLLPAAAPPPLRVAALDYGLAQTAVALGADLVGLPDPADYRAWVVSPPIPDGVRDLGGRVQPNLEVLRALRPDLILAIPDHAPVVPALTAIAPVLTLPIYTPARQPWAQSEAAARAIGARLGRDDDAERLIDAAAARLAAGRAALAGRPPRPVLLASVSDPRHLLLYGTGSILHAALERLGLRNAWTGTTGRWGTVAVPLERLATIGDATLVLIEPLPPDLEGALAASPLWRALPFARPGRTLRIPPVLMFGTLPAAERFADLLVPLLREEAARA